LDVIEATALATLLAHELARSGFLNTPINAPARIQLSD